MNYCDISIDLGSSSTKIFIKGCGLIANVNSVVAVNKNNGQIIDIGERAYEMMGRAPEYVHVTCPILNGTVAHYGLTKILINEILARFVNKPIKNPRIFICVHGCETELEKYTLINSVFSCQFGEIFLVQESVASGFGAGFDLSHSKSLVVVNIGAGTTDMVFIDENGKLKTHSVKLGGFLLDEAVKTGLLKKYGLIVGRLSAENLKIKAANLHQPNYFKKFKISGKNRLTKLPQSLFISSAELFDLIQPAVDKLVLEIKNFVQFIPQFSSKSEFKGRILLTGGTSLMKGLTNYVENKLKIETNVAVDPISCTICGMDELFADTYLKTGTFVKPA